MRPPAARWACVPNTKPWDLIILPRRSLHAFVHSAEELCRAATLRLCLPRDVGRGLPWGLDLEMAVIHVFGAVLRDEIELKSLPLYLPLLRANEAPLG